MSPFSGVTLGMVTFGIGTVVKMVGAILSLSDFSGVNKFDTFTGDSGSLCTPSKEWVSLGSTKDYNSSLSSFTFNSKLS